MEEKVILAINNVFIYKSIKKTKDELGYIIDAKSDSLASLTKIHKMLREQRILDSARKHLFRGVGEGKLKFMINKQAAYKGILVFADDPNESPLGPITFIVEYVEPKSVIDWLAPKTSNGKPLWDRPIPES